MQYAVRCVQCAVVVYSVKCAMCSVQCAMCNVQLEYALKCIPSRLHGILALPDWRPEEMLASFKARARQLYWTDS